MDFTPEQETVIKGRIETDVATALENHKPEITNALAQDFLKNQGINTFKSKGDYNDDIVKTMTSITSGSRIENPNELEKAVLTFKSNLAGEVLSPVDQVFKNLTGHDKLEKEKTREYITRVLPLLEKGGSGDLAQLNALEAKLVEANKLTSNSVGELKKVQNELFSRDKNALISKGLPDNLDYSAQEMEFMLPGIIAQFEAKYNLEKDDKGFRAVDILTNTQVSLADGIRKPVQDVFKEFITAMPNLRLKLEDGKPRDGARLPGDLPAKTPEQEKELNDKFIKALAEKNLFGHEKESWLLRKDMGMPIPEKAIKQWPELKPQ
jgi:hypothetical protein